MNRSLPNLRTALVTLPLVLACLHCGPGQDGPDGAMLRTIDGRSVAVAEIEELIPAVMAKADVAGLSVAIINDSQIAYTRAFGFKNAAAETRPDEQTIFAAASFSKPVFAYLVMLLAEDGVIDLDTPLVEYVDRPLVEYPQYADLEGDERYRRITARMVLSHSTGFPNLRWLQPDGRLAFLFDPGTRFSYSGEGFLLLQMVVEHLTGKGLEVLARERVFAPLAMTRTSFVWQEAFADNHALPHNEFKRPRKLHPYREANAAGSMVTTAGDFARFVVAILGSEGKRRATIDEMLKPQIRITSKRMFGPGAWEETGATDPLNLSWGLGWGRFDTEQGRAFFHTGHDRGAQNYTVTYADRGIGIVLMSNSDNFESVAQELVAGLIGDAFSPFSWLGYVPFDPVNKRTPPPEPVAIQVDPEILAAYVGEYRLADGTPAVVKMEEGRLFLRVGSQEWNELHASSETEFFLPMEDATMSFIKDASGAVTELVVRLEGVRIAFQKID